MSQRKRILFIAATHGDEGFSIPVLQALEQKLPKETYGYDWIIGNPKALEKGVRYIDADMNRAAPGNSKSDMYEDRRVAEIMSIAKEYDMVIDIHGTQSDCGVTTLIPSPTQSNIQLAEQLGVQKNVVWQSSNPDRVTGPISEFVETIAVEIECGPKADEMVAKELQTVLEKFIISNYENRNNQFDSEAELYEVYGKLIDEGVKKDLQLQDFIETSYQNEVFYPYLSKNDYVNILCYKMRKVSRDHFNETTRTN